MKTSKDIIQGRFLLAGFHVSGERMGAKETVGRRGLLKGYAFEIRFLPIFHYY